MLSFQQQQLTCLQTSPHTHLEMVRRGVELPAAFIFTPERLLAHIRDPRWPVVLTLQHNLKQKEIWATLRFQQQMRQRMRSNKQTGHSTRMCTPLSASTLPKDPRGFSMFSTWHRGERTRPDLDKKVTSTQQMVENGLQYPKEAEENWIGSQRQLLNTWTF